MKIPKLSLDEVEIRAYRNFNPPLFVCAACRIQRNPKFLQQKKLFKKGKNLQQNSFIEEFNSSTYDALGFEETPDLEAVPTLSIG